jgi:uncharacterized membrane protein HdeD (DUF308 family)
MTEKAVDWDAGRSRWWLFLMMGILNVIVGILLLTNPARTTLAFVWVLGVCWFVKRYSCRSARS